MRSSNKMDKYTKFLNDIGKKYLISGQLRFDEPLKNHTTFKIGGPAKIFFKAKSVDQLIKAVRICQKLGLPYFILGAGSNILVSDQGFKGVVVKNKARKIKLLGYKGKINNQSASPRTAIKDIFIEAESGVLVNRLVRYTLDQGLAGLENFLGLPGTVGGAVHTNAHYLKANDFFNRHVVKVHLLSSDEKTILKAVLSLKKSSKKEVWQKADQIMDYRIKTQPLEKPSAGCIFKNIKKSEALRISTPKYTTSAGYLIEAVGLKGKKIGNAQVSSLHANFIVNIGGATASDVVKLIHLIKKEVKKKFGVELEEEIGRVGEFRKS